MIFLISKYIRKEDKKTVLNCGTVGVICPRINYAVVVFPIIPWLVCNRISNHSTKFFTIIQAFDTTRLYHLSPRHETFLLADTISAGPPFWKSSNWEKQKNLPRVRKTFALSYIFVVFSVVSSLLRWSAWHGWPKAVQCAMHLFGELQSHYLQYHRLPFCRICLPYGQHSSQGFFSGAVRVLSTRVEWFVKNKLGTLHAGPDCFVTLI